MKILGARRSWIIRKERSQIRFSPKSNQGAVAQTASRTFADSDGNLNVFNVERNKDGQWLNTNYGNPDNMWNPDNRWVFARRNSLYFPVQAGFSFAVAACRLHPPSIFPSSLNLSESAIYFFLSRAFISQRICRKNFVRSSCAIAFSK